MIAFAQMYLHIAVLNRARYGPAKQRARLAQKRPDLAAQGFTDKVTICDMALTMMVPLQALFMLTETQPETIFRWESLYAIAVWSSIWIARLISRMMGTHQSMWQIIQPSDLKSL